MMMRLPDTLYGVVVLCCNTLLFIFYYIRIHLATVLAWDKPYYSLRGCTSITSSLKGVRRGGQGYVKSPVKFSLVLYCPM